MRTAKRGHLMLRPHQGPRTDCKCAAKMYDKTRPAGAVAARTRPAGVAAARSGKIEVSSIRVNVGMRHT